MEDFILGDQYKCARSQPPLAPFPLKWQSSAHGCAKTNPGGGDFHLIAAREDRGARAAAEQILGQFVEAAKRTIRGGIF